MMMLKQFCIFAGLLALVCVARHEAQGAPARPNIVFILIDDMGYADLSCYGGPTNASPNIDRLAREGIRFAQAYVGSPICSPSRTAFITGRFPAHSGITSFLAARGENEQRGMPNWLDPKTPTLAKSLKSAGYRTGHFGKWHMGGQRNVGDAPLITEYGFDESLTQFEGLGDRILPLLDAHDGTKPQPYALGSDNLGRGNIQWMDRSKVTGAFVDRALQFIRKSQEEQKPFYINLWPDDVHSPFFPPGARTNEAKADLYRAVVRAMDAQFAPLFDYLRGTPSLRTNTIVVLTSDNGPEPGAGSAGPFKGHKGRLHEGGIREPMIVWAPGFMERSATGTLDRRTVVSAVDLYPTIAELAGAKVGPELVLDGENLSDDFLGRANHERKKPLFWTRPPDRPGPPGAAWPDLAMRRGNWKLLTMLDGSRPELYDLLNDPGEEKNMATERPELATEMNKELQAWRNGLPERVVRALEPARLTESQKKGKNVTRRTKE